MARQQNVAHHDSSRASIPISYMGTKRHLAQRVCEIVTELESVSRVVDPFSGMGSVAASLQSILPVSLNDALQFTSVLHRTRFTGTGGPWDPDIAGAKLHSAYASHKHRLSSRFASLLDQEEGAMSSGRSELAEFMSEAPHVGKDSGWAQSAKRAARSSHAADRFALATLYFGGGYFSFRQAISLDALRAAIESVGSASEIDWLLSAYLATCGSLINGPGHTAQYFKPTSPQMHTRIVRQWKRPVWSTFVSHLQSIQPLGSASWRSRNSVNVGDAIEFIESHGLLTSHVVYADPPYSRGQYSRYYHVYETLFLYDYPDSSGEGRYRSDRFKSSFGRKSEVLGAFQSLVSTVSSLGARLVLSYPTNGLLQKAGRSLEDLLETYFSNVRLECFSAMHSTMGAASRSRQPVTERLFVCI